ncbi:MAG: 4a-hydroxytetrahydrobiopterin dehydratase [Rhodococcus sp.]|nr:4a-hydroxytetrahydrobiopterin dehydratase [Rhodococcus sp. (in: high G+C Gram-positive bacteria)]
MAELLSDGLIDTALAELPDWHRSGDSIVRTVESPSFPEAIALVVKVAEMAESAGHHPDIDVRWRKVTYTLSTHSSGGITQRDLDLAAQIDAAIPH